MSKERWLDAVGFENYEVSSKGRVRSKNRTIEVNGHNRVYVSRMLRINVCSRGFCNVTLSVEGNRISRRVHKLVAESFIPRVHGKNQVVHKDGDKGNNTIENLKWCTHIGSDYYIG